MHLAGLSLLSDSSPMSEVRKTLQFQKWLENLKDIRIAIKLANAL